MNFIEAAKISNFVRRKGLKKHIGSNGDGWIDARYSFEQGRNRLVIPGCNVFWLLTWDDLMVEDWVTGSRA